MDMNSHKHTPTLAHMHRNGERLSVERMLHGLSYRRRWNLRVVDNCGYKPFAETSTCERERSILNRNVQFAGFGCGRHSVILFRTFLSEEVFTVH